MALGTLGSTLNDELNRLANGGTYRTMPNMVDEALAAKQWANRENIIPYSTDTVGILNEIAGLGLDKKNWLDFNGVCNYIAGTTGLPAAAALRQVYPTTDLLTGVASYYVDATAPRYNYPGFITLNGSTSNYLSVPDIDYGTTSFDLRIQLAADDWTPTANQSLITKSISTTAFNWRINTDGTLFFRVVDSGGVSLDFTSSVATGLVDGVTSWLRVTFLNNNGSSNSEAKFYTSTDGSTWTQLGTTRTAAVATALRDNADNVEIGGIGNGAVLFSGKVYRAQIFAGTAGTDKRLDVDLTTNVTSATFNQFTATTGQLVTINGQDVLTNGGAAGSLLPTTVGSSTAADSNDPKFLDHTGTNYVYTPGTQLSNMSVPDGAAFDITGDIDLRAYVAMDDWTPSAISALVTKWDANQWSYSLSVDTNGTLLFDWSATGSLAINKNSTVATGLTDGTAKWVRATLDVDNGASGNTVTFYTSDNGTSWTQLGSAVTTAGVTSIYSGTANVIIGARTQGFGQSSAAKIYRSQIFNGIDGTKVLDVDTSVITAGSATSFTAVTGQTVTINRSTSGRKTVAVTQPTWLFGTDDYMEVNNRYMAHSTAAENYVYLSGASGNYMSIPDNPPLDITGDLDLRVNVALDDWTPGTTNTLFAKYNTTGNQRSYRLDVSATTGILTFVWSANGTTAITANSTVAPTVTDGATLWVRATLDVDNGASGNTVTFYTSTNGTTWTQLGSPVVTAGTTSIYSGTAVQEIGSYNAGTATPAKGKFFRAQVLNGIDGTIVLDADASVITLPSQTTFVDRSSNAYTVTINKSGVGTFVSTGNYLYLPGVASNYASAPDSVALDITGDIDIRVKVALDDWTPSATNGLIAKNNNASNYSYALVLASSGVLQLRFSLDGTNTILPSSTIAPTVADGATLWVRATRASATGTVQFFTSNDGITWTQLGTDVSTTSGSIYSGTSILEIGSSSFGGSPARGKFFRAQVYNGINGTLAFDANFESSITSLLQTSFTESSTNAATVTINRSGSTFRSAGVIDAGYLYPGATNTFSASATDFLNFGLSDSITMLAIARRWGIPSGADQRIIMKWNGSGYYLSYTTVGNGTSVFQGTGTGGASRPFTSGTLSSIVSVRNTATDLVTTYVNETTGSSAADNTTTTLANIDTLSIGRQNVGGTAYADMELIGAAIFRTALTAAQIRQIVNYFANREVYL